MSGKPRRRQTPTVRQVDDAKPEEQDKLRVKAKQAWLDSVLDSISDDPNADGFVEAQRRRMVDLLDIGLAPPRLMWRMYSDMLKAAYWPSRGRKQAKRIKEAAWLHREQIAIDHLAATKYRDARNPRTLAEKEVAERHKLSVKDLRRKRARFRDRLKKHQAEVKRLRLKKYEAEVERLRLKKREAEVKRGAAVQRRRSRTTFRAKLT